jgi:anthranilate phosphoribosyltransferase
VVLNTGAALFGADRVKSITEGWTLAEKLIDDGMAAAKLRALANRVFRHSEFGVRS